MAPSIFHILIAFGGIQAFFLSIILASRRSNLSGRLFSIFLAIEGIILIERLLADTGLMVQFPQILGVGYPISFLKPPIIYLLTFSLIDSGFKLRKKHALHLMPFFLITLSQIPFFMLPGEIKVEQVTAFINYIPEFTEFVFWFIFSFFLYIGIYMYLSIRTLIKYRSNIKSNTQANWYSKVLYLYSAFLVISLFQYLIRPTQLIEIPFVNTVNMLMMTFIIQSIAYILLSRSQVLNQTNGRFSPAHVSQLTKDRQRIKDKLENEKVYRDDSLNLAEFSASLDLSKKYVSDIINQSFGTTFKALINRYRVGEVIELMHKQKDSDFLLTDLGLDSGFNNKVTFYRTFKQYTGKSPREYFKDVVR